MFELKRRPTTPGEILKEEFLIPMGMTQGDLAERMGVSMQRINTIINGRRAVTAETALLLSRVFRTTAEFWMNLQAAVDLYDARQKMKRAS